MRMLIGACALSLMSGVHAASTPTTLDTLVVTGQREATPVGRLADAVLVIDRAQIEASGAASVADLLRGRAGIEIQDLFGDGSRVNVGLRGFGENAASNTLILLDGRPLNNPDIGSPDLGRLALEEIERIEILHGGGALYGDQAVGGVIQILTRSATQPQAAVQLRAGSYEQRGAHASLQTRIAGVTGRLSARAQRSDNYRDHNALRRQGAGLDLSGDIGPLRWNAAVDYIDEDLQTPGALFADEVAADRRQSAPDFAADFSQLRTLDWQAGLDWTPDPAWSLHLGLGRRDGDGRFRLSFRGAQSDPAVQDRQVDSLHWRATRRFVLRERAGHWQLGTDLRRADYLLNSQFGEQRNRQSIDAVYLGSLLPIAADWDLNLAVRHSRAVDRIRDTGQFASVPNGLRISHHETMGSVGLVWRALPSLKAFAGWDEVLRYPKVDEYFGSGFTPDTIGLAAQTGDSYELGVQFTPGRIEATALAFWLDLHNEIVFDPGSFTNVNLDRSRRRGALANLRWPLGSAVTAELSYTLVNAELRSGNTPGKEIPLVAKHIGRLALGWQVTAGWRLQGDMVVNSRRALAGDFDNSLPTLPGFATVGVGAQYAHDQWQWRLRINNLLDREYAEQGIEAAPPPTFSSTPAYFPSPGRNLSLSLRRVW